ncbi:MAG: hypothetical protein O2837_05645, partial [Bacteroidetes bacterium]|nr:hypothetical protein [Bacteroidota bacterium]
MNCLHTVFTKLDTIKSPILLIGILFFHSINILAIEVDINKIIIDGCMDPLACNYNSLALDPASCIYSTDLDDCASCSGATDGTGIIVDNDADDDGVCDDDEIPGCTIAVACNYDPEATDHVEALCDFTSCYVFGCLNAFACNYNPLADYDDPNGLLNDPCEYASCTGCTDNTSCDYDLTATISDPLLCSDYTSCYGCMEPDADNYDLTATIACVTEDCCIYYGCTYAVACNYDATANTNDGSCDWASCAGCTTPIACNYDSDVTLHDADTCIYPEEGYDCDGNCLVDTDGDGVCDMFEIPGCDDVDALNYDPTVTDNDNTCNYPVPGCMDVIACNYDNSATVDDGSCEFTSCVG